MEARKSSGRSASRARVPRVCRVSRPSLLSNIARFHGGFYGVFTPRVLTGYSRGTHGVLAVQMLLNIARFYGVAPAQVSPGADVGRVLTGVLTAYSSRGTQGVF